MTHLVSLPTELLCEIIRHLLPQPAETLVCPPPDPYYYSEARLDLPAYLQWTVSPRLAQQSLYALARTCRTLGPLALEALKHNWAAVLKQPLIRRLRSLAQRRALFDKVTDVNIENGDMEAHVTNLSRSSQLRAEIDNFSLPDNVLRRLYRPILEDTAYAELAILLLKTPNLSTLRVHRYGRMWPSYRPGSVKLRC